MAAKVKALQEWCKRQCDGYRDVSVTNMTSSWRSGLAFCAIIHRYRPDIIDYDSLSKEDVYENNQLAFETAERELEIPALLDAEDMVAMKVPDKLCVVTYVAQYHNYFRKFQPAGGPGVKATRTATKRMPPEPIPSEPPQMKKPARTVEQGQEVVGGGDTAVGKRDTLGDTCSSCHQKVFIMERHMDGNRLFHRRCFRDKQRSQRSSWERPPPSDSYMPRKDAEAGRNGPSLIGMLHSVKTSDVRGGSEASVKPASGVNVRAGNGTNVKAVSSQSTAPSQLMKSLYTVPQYVSPMDPVKHSWSSETQTTPVSKANVNLLPPLHTTTASYNLSQSSDSKKTHSPRTSPRLANKRAEEPMDTDTSKKATRPTDFSPSQTRPTRRDMRPRANDQSKLTSSKASTPENPTAVPVSKTSLSDTKVVSGLLQSLAKVRQEQSFIPAPSSQPSQPPSYKSNLKHSNVSSPVNTAGRTVTIKETSPVNRTRARSSPNDSSYHRVNLKPVESAAEPSRNRSSSPPKSILKHGSEHTSPMESGAGSRNASPPRSILKHTEFSPDTKQEDAPPRSILKRGSFDSDVDSDDHGGFRPKSILKRDSLGSDPDSGPNSRVTSPCRSILKSSMSAGESEDESKAGSRHESPRSILKRNSLEQQKIDWPMEGEQESTSQSKSILKSASPTRDGAPKRKSILKMKPTNEQPSQPKPEEASSKLHSTAKSPPGPEKNSTINNFSAFNLSDSICVKEALPRKPIWEFEAEARQAYKSPANGMSHVSKFSKESEHPHSQASQGVVTSPKQSRTAVSSVTTQDNKPAWQKDAEKRQAMRGGKYVDPEKKHLQTTDSGEEQHVKLNGHASKKDVPARPVYPPAGGTKPKTPPARPKTPPSRCPEPVPVPVQNQQRKAGVVGGGDHVTSGKSGVSVQDQRPAWQLEAERRQALRNGQYVDPEKHPRLSPTLNSPSSVHKPSPQASPASGYRHSPKTSPRSSDLGKMIHPQTPPSVSPSSDPSRRSVLSRSPAFRIPESSPDSSPASLSPPHTASPTPPHFMSAHTPHSNTDLLAPIPTSKTPEFAVNPNRKKITPDVDFSFGSVEFNKLNTLDGVTAAAPPSSDPIPPPRWNRDQMRGRPLPMVPGNNMPIPKRRVNAEERMSSDDILHCLDILDQQLRIMEEEGRVLEEKIRSGTDDDMDEDVLMVQWFELVNQKNELVRKETDLMYRQRQQDLEDHHEELEYELRCLMQKPESQKTGSDKVREEALLKDLMDTVMQRNNIVDSMEEDRIRYIEEDQEIAEVLAHTANPKKKKKNKKGGKENRIHRDITSSPEYELDELDVQKEQEKSKKKGRKFFKKGTSCT